jgi:hypothetical protein
MTLDQVRDCLHVVRHLGPDVSVFSDAHRMEYGVKALHESTSISFTIPFGLMDQLFPGRVDPWTVDRVRDAIMGPDKIKSGGAV